MNCGVERASCHCQPTRNLCTTPKRQLKRILSFPPGLLESAMSSEACIKLRKFQRIKIPQDFCMERLYQRYCNIAYQ